MKNRMLVLPLLYHDLRSGYNMYSALPICRRSPGGPVKPSVLNSQLNDMVVQDWTGLDWTGPLPFCLFRTAVCRTVKE